MALEVAFENDAEQELKRLAASEETTIPAVLQEAIALKTWTDEIKRSGQRLYVRDERGKLQEVAV